MKQIRTTDPSGRQWVVRRRWLPWNIQWRGLGRPGHGLENLDLLDLFGLVDDVPPLLGLILLLVFLGFLIFFVLPIAVFLIELLLLTLVTVLVLFVRLMLRRHWLVDAIEGSSERPQYVWAVTGWRASGQAVEQVAAQIQAGTQLPLVADGQLIAQGER